MADLQNIQKGDIADIPGFGLIKVIRTFPLAYNRQVFLGERLDLSQKRWVIKTFRFPSYLTQRQAETEASVIEGRTRSYKQQLLDAGVSVVRDLGFSSYIPAGGQTTLIQFEEYAGETSTFGIQKLKLGLVLQLVRATCEQIAKPLFFNTPDPTGLGRLTLGVDLNHRNVTYYDPEENGDFHTTYVDLFPQKIILSCGGHGLEYPEPEDERVRKLGIFRSYNMVGLIVNYWASLVNAQPEYAQYFYDEIEDFIHQSGLKEQYQLEEQIDDYIENRDLRVGREDEATIEKLIANWGFEEIFKLRLLACALAFHRPASRSLLPDIFYQTHFQDKSLPQEHMDKKVKEPVLRMASLPVV